MQIWNRQLSDKTPLFKPLLSIIILALLSIGTFLAVSDHYVNTLFERVEKQYRQNLINIVSVARHSVEPVLKKVRSGEISRAEAIERIRPMIRAMTYEDRDGKNYVFMTSYDGTTLVKPYEPDQEMKNQLNLLDIKGVYILRELIKAAKTTPEGSFVRYHYPHFSRTTDIEEKLTYVVGLPEIECYIGTGMYMKRIIQEQRETLAKAKYAAILMLFVLFIPISASIFVILHRNKQLQAEVMTRKKAEEDLKRGEEKYRSIFENAIEGIFQTTPDGHLISVNPALARIFGYESPQAMLDSGIKTDQLYADPEEREQVLRMINEEGFVKDHLLKMKRRDGAILWFSLSTRVVRNNEGDILYYEGTMEDVTQRKSTEEELREKEQRLSAIAGNLPGGVYQFCARDNGEWEPTYVSERLREIFGLSFEMSKEFTIFLSHVHEEDRERFMASIRKAVETCSPWDFEGRFLRPSGETIWFHGLSTPSRHEDCVIFDGILLDVTEHKGQEEKSRLSEEKFSKVFLTTPDCIAISRLADGRLMELNLGFEEITGWKRSEAVGQTAFDIDFWVETSARELMEEDLKAGREILNREFLFRRKDGSVRNGVYSARSIQIAGEACLIFVMQDITEHKQTEDALQKTASELRLLFKNMLNGFIIWESVFDEEGRYVSFRFGFFNDAFTRILALDREQVTGKDVFEVWPGTEPSWIEAYGKVAVSGNPYTFDMYHAPTQRWYHCNAYRPTDSPAQICVIFEDITERKQAEEAIRQSEEQFRSLFEAYPGGVTLLKERRFQKVNSMLCRMVGYSADELLGRTTRMLYADEDEYESISGKMNDRMVQDGLGMMETRLRHKNGRLLDIYLSGSYLDPQNPFAGMVVAILDITDRKRFERASRQLEQQLNQAQKLDAIGQLAGGIAHDFNNILMGIQGNASMSMMEYQPGHPQYQRMSRIEEYVKRGANLTRQLLGFAREGKYELKTLSLNDLLRKSTRFFIETHKEIEAIFSLQEDLHPVETDAGQLEQVFLNLFINAGHAMPKGGRLYIQTANLTLQETDVAVFQVKPGDYVKISVSDTGTGMDAKTLEKIFEPFFTTKSEQGGTGLGLASSYGIIRNHGGIINAYSEPGHGATFHIYLPSSEKKVEKEETPLQDKGLLRGTGGVLLIDDEPFILELGSELLTMLGYTVYQAENKEDALFIYRENMDRIDLIILDMILRGTSGSEVLKTLRTINPEVKVILSSGYGLQGEVQRVMEMGCLGFIQKPYNFSDFSRIVHSALNPPEQADAP